MLNREKFIRSPVIIKKELLCLFRKEDDLIIFDIGACEAEDSIRYSKLFPKATVFAFEPRPDNFTKAKELINQYQCKNSIVLEKLALSNANGVADFFVSEGEPNELKNDEHWNYGNKSSSLLPPSDNIKNHTAWLQFKKKIPVKTLRLDDYVAKNEIQSIDFLHLDVQGAELMVLEGAGIFLEKIKLIWLEVETVELYNGQPLKNDVEQFMAKAKFINIIDMVDNVSGDQLYVNQNYFNEKEINSLLSLNKRKGLLHWLQSFFTK